MCVCIAHNSIVTIKLGASKYTEDKVGPQSWSGWAASRLWDLIICCCVMTMVTRTGWSKIYRVNCRLLIKWYFQTKLWMMRLEWGIRTEATLSHSEATSNKLPVDQTHNGSSLEKTPEFEPPCSGPVGPQTPALLVQWASPGIRGVPGVRSQEPGVRIHDSWFVIHYSWFMILALSAATCNSMCSK